MSEPLNNNPIQHYKRTPKKFLKKGEGLKRFAAYKPPLPAGTKRKRQTVVKFDLFKNSYAESKSTYLPEILLDDSANLSMEVPKIGPPKIFHTPIRPPTASRFNVNNNNLHEEITTKQDNNKQQNKKNGKRYNLRKRGQIEAVVQRHITPPDSPSADFLQPSTPPPKNVQKVTSEDQINGNIDNLMKKIKHKKTILDQENIVTTAATTTTTMTNTNTNTITTSPAQINNNNYKSGVDIHHSIVAFGKQIQQIQSTVNELKQQITNCTCGMEPAKRATRRTVKARPSAPADNSTKHTFLTLMDDVALLKEKFDDLQLMR